MRNATMATGSSNLKVPTMRITRARAKTLGSSGGLPPLHPSVRQDKKQGLVTQGTKSKRPAPDENKPANSSSTASQQPKRRAVLRDVTNVLCENPYMNCINGSKFQVKKFSDKRNSKVIPALLVKKPELEDRKESVIEEAKMIKVEESQEHCSQAHVKDHPFTQPSEYITAAQSGLADLMPVNRSSCNDITLQTTTPKDESKVCLKQEGSNSLSIADIDSKHKDPLMCSLYAPDIYNNLQAMELDRRPSFNYMEKLQRDINKGMRSILIDWLVEVSEEYRLVPDTLYLTVHLIDRFLSEHYIEKQKLQLLGVTCMLIASKYEEICAPRVEEFCFITDNTYSKEEVVRMESLVLNFLGFQLAAPTTKKFLRRFVQASQASYEVPSVELEFMANYLAELTLAEYSFLKFLPSVTAASAVFLARWTLDQSNHPWNSTLEHYTTYKASDLKTTVLLLQDLQMNTSGSTLNAIRDGWSLVRRFDQPQRYKPFVSRCVMQGDLEIGSVREVNVRSGLPATTSKERLELLDDEEHIFGVKIVGGDHRLQNYSSIITVHPEVIDGRPGTIVIESFVVDIPDGNTKDETCFFVEALIRCNLKSLADVSERLAVQGHTDPIDRI